MNKIKVIPLRVPSEADLALITDAARLTQVFDYSPTGQFMPGLAKRLMDMQHWAPFEFCDMTVLIKGCSRTFLAQITRHRLCSFISSSQQYQDHSKFDYVVPTSITGSDLKMYQKTMEKLRADYITLVEAVGKDDARYVLPNACRVDLMVKANLREWLSVIIPQRSCKRNTPETIHIMKLICALLPIDLLTGPECITTGGCNQGKMSCRDLYQSKMELLP